jgi:hypothetical protein
MGGSKLNLNKAEFTKWFLENHTSSEILDERQYKKAASIGEDYLVAMCIQETNCKVMVLDNKITFHKSITYKEMQKMYYDRFNAIEPTPTFYSVWSAEVAAEVSINPPLFEKVIDGKVW